MHPLARKRLPFPVGGPSLQNANVRCSRVRHLLLKLRELHVIAKFSGMMEKRAMPDKSWPDITKSLVLRCL